ncbi:TPA: hypothetical protein ACPSKB_000105 [Legionella feeleii]
MDIFLSRNFKNETDKQNTCYVVPIKNLILSDKKSNNLIINGVQFVSLNTIKKNKRLNFSSSLIKQNKHNFFSSMSYAIKEYFTYDENQHDTFHKEVNDALDILALSQLIFAKRDDNAVLSFSNERSINSITFFVESNKQLFLEYKILDSQSPLTINEQWHKIQKLSFFDDLVGLINNKKRKGKRIQYEWKRKIISSALMAGKSQRSRNIWLSFLLNIIAMENLLMVGDEKIANTLPLRVEAFIGWSNDWKKDNLHQEVSNLYKKRCNIVHRGNLDITADDLLLSDYFLFNILQNILKHLELFHNQNSLIVFSEKVQAEKLLGFDLSVRPNTLQDIAHFRRQEKEYVPKHIWDIIEHINKHSSGN